MAVRGARGHAHCLLCACVRRSTLCVMAVSVDQLLDEYSTADAIAEEIISEKHQISDLDRKRNSAREALRHLKKVLPISAAGSASWTCFGNTFIKMDSSSCIRMLEEDHKDLSTEIETLRENLKPKVAALHQLEGKAEVKGFNLQGMRSEELINIRSE